MLDGLSCIAQSRNASISSTRIPALIHESIERTHLCQRSPIPRARRIAPRKIESPLLLLTAFVNEPMIDWSNPENVRKMQAAIEKVRSELGREYDLVIGGRR